MPAITAIGSPRSNCPQVGYRSPATPGMTGLDSFNQTDVHSPSSCASPSTKRYSGPITPVLDMKMERVPFSDSFSHMMEPIIVDEDVLIGTGDKRGLDPLYEKEVGDADSFTVKMITNRQDMDPRWADDEIDEIVLISPKPKSSHCFHEDCPKLPNIQMRTVIDYAFLHVLGSGRTAKVFLARDERDGMLYAVKSVRKSAVYHVDAAAHARSEQACLKMVTTLRAAFLPRLHKSFQDNERLYLILDYYPGGDLLTHICRAGPFSAERIQFYACEVAEAMTYLHSIGIVHRDLTPENILMAADGHLVVSDFGCAKMLFSSDGQRTASRCGTQEYYAPEMLLDWSYDFTVDCWAFGLLLYFMAFGRHPFMKSHDNEDPEVMQNKILRGPTPFPIAHPTTSTLQDLQEKVRELSTSEKVSYTLPVSGAKSRVAPEDACNTSTSIFPRNARSRPFPDWPSSDNSNRDWALVSLKQYPVPFVPNLAEHQIDLQYFEGEILNMNVETLSLHFDEHPASTPDPDTFKDFSFTWDPRSPTYASQPLQETETVFTWANLIGTSTKKSASESKSHKSASSRPSTPVIRHIRSILKQPSLRFPAELRRRKSLLNSATDRPKSHPNLTAKPEGTPHKIEKRRASVPNPSDPDASSASSNKPLPSLPFPAVPRHLKALPDPPVDSAKSGTEPVTELPRDMVQNGLGIEFTKTPPGSRLSISSIASKSCFSGLGFVMRRRRGKDTRKESLGGGIVMRQEYGSSWSVGIDNDGRMSTVTIGTPDGLGPRDDFAGPVASELHASFV